MKTEQEICTIINKYENSHPAICGTDSLIKFIQWYQENYEKKVKEAIDKVFDKDDEEEKVYRNILLKELRLGE